MFTRLKQGLVKRLGGWNLEPGQVVAVYAPDRDVRSMPGQALERARYLYAFGPDCVEYLVAYAMDAWVYTAVQELATDFASAPLEVWRRGSPQKAEKHGILSLLGPAGRPNADDDLFEFLERHISNFLLTGNSYWYWYNRVGGEPEAVYNLPVEAMRIVPGGSDVVGEYVMEWQGDQIHLPKVAVTHYKKFHPLSRYYGLGALEALRLEVQSDRSMARWNYDFFGADVFAPAGILVVDDTVGDKERERLEAELEGKHGQRRRTAVVKARPGSTVWLDAGLKHKDLDFANGRLLSRQAVYEALGLPLGLWSESSTEAHARVAERLKLNTVYKMHQRTAVKINQDALPFWPRSSSYEARFTDIRKVDWQMEKLKLDSLRGLLTKNEIREIHLSMPGIEGGDELDQPQPFGGGFGQDKEKQGDGESSSVPGQS